MFGMSPAMVSRILRRLGRSIGIESALTPEGCAWASAQVFGVVGDEDLQIFIWKSVLSDMNVRARSASPAMSAAMLIGTPFTLRSRLAVEIDGCIGVQSGDGDTDELTITQAAWKSVLSERDRHWSGRLIVGWVISMPSKGVFVSGQNEDVHRAMFGDLHQVHVCIDPDVEQLCFFQIRSGWLSSVGFHVVEPLPGYGRQ